MATRNLARSVTEGGRSKVSRQMERFDTRSHRKAGRRFCSPGNDHDADPGPSPHPPNIWGKAFTDKFGPVYRYLRANVGRPWDKVFSELCQRYDRRTLKAWHLIDSHIKRGMVQTDVTTDLNGVPRVPPYYYFSDNHWVDRHGILRYTPAHRWRR